MVPKFTCFRYAKVKNFFCLTFVTFLVFSLGFPLLPFDVLANLAAGASDVSASVESRFFAKISQINHHQEEICEEK